MRHGVNIVALADRIIADAVASTKTAAVSDAPQAEPVLLHPVVVMLKQAAAANKLMLERRLDPCMSEVFTWADLPNAHMKMLRNEHKPGNMAVLIQSPKTGLRTFEDALEAGR